MPELPEAETIARGLDSRLARSSIERVRVFRDEVVAPMRPRVFARAFAGRRIDRVGRRAKWIVASLDDGTRWVTQLRMTGRFEWLPPGRLTSAPHLSLSFLASSPAGGGIVRFFDVRRFARMWVLSPDDWREVDERLGIEPLSDEFTPDSLAGAVGASRAPIRNALLDQRRVVGIGNIYASEACHLARIDPRRASRDLSSAEIGELHGAVRHVLERAIREQGTSLSDYRSVTGEVGSYQNELTVYGRDGEECLRCGGVIERSVMAGRSAFYCSRCQT